MHLSVQMSNQDTTNFGSLWTSIAQLVDDGANVKPGHYNLRFYAFTLLHEEIEEIKEIKEIDRMDRMDQMDQINKREEKQAENGPKSIAIHGS